ncbi:MAG: lytic murein transglycosylase [Candidatus Moraniibacteriota bacterium]
MHKKKKLFLTLALVLVVPVFVMSQISFWSTPAQAGDIYDARIAAEKAAAQAILDAAKKVADEKLAAEQKAAEEERQAEIDKAKDAKDDLESKLKKEKAALSKLEKQQTQIGQSVSTTQKTINTTKSVIVETDKTLTKKEQEIINLSNQIVLQQELLKNLIQQSYYLQSQPILNVVLNEGDFSQFFSGAQHLTSLDEKILGLVAEINSQKDQLAGDKAELSKKKEQHLDILAQKTVEKKELVADQLEVQGDIEDKNAIISKLKKQLVELQGDLSTLTGKSYNAKDIRGAVEDASRETGVPEGVLYGFLKMETNLGANTGQCTYSEVEKVSVANYKKYGSKYKASIALLYKRQDLFYSLVGDLGYGKDKKVSCTPSVKNYIGQGGAMGVPQFMSDVWNSYSAQITSATGHKTPDPWNLTDGVMGMAIKLKKAGATSSSESAIKKASTSYLGTFNANYYNGIVYWSKNYKLLFE